MSVLTTVKELLQASTESASRGDPTADSPDGAYWCHDCAERIRDVDVEADSTPECPDCGDEMAFERSPDATSCAC